MFTSYDSSGSFIACISFYSEFIPFGNIVHGIFNRNNNYSVVNIPAVAGVDSVVSLGGRMRTVRYKH